MKNRRLYIISIIGLFIVGLIISFVYKTNINKYEINQSFLESLNTYCNTDWINEQGFKEQQLSYNTTHDLLDKSENIVRVKATDRFEIIGENFLHAVEIQEIYKGNIENKIIYVFEPIYLNLIKSNEYISSEGYNIMRTDKEYILFLKPFYQFQSYQNIKKDQDVYILENFVFGKYNMTSYNNTISLKSELQPFNFKDIENFEFLTNSQEHLEEYLSWKKEIFDLLNIK